MNWVVFGRVAKFIALFGFFLPWAVFSCSGQEFATMSGFDVAIGHFHSSMSMYGQTQSQDQNIGLNIFVIVAIIVIVLGLLSSFTSDQKDAARALLIGAIVGVVAVLGGMIWLKGTIQREAQNQANRANGSYQAQVNTSAAALIQINEKYGYFITLLGLVGAGAAGGLAMAGNELPALPTSIGEWVAPVARRPEDDIADWDRIANKDDPDQLQEYLLRHPNGRFAELARMKLERLGIEPLKAAPPPPRPEPQAAPAVQSAPAPSLEVTPPRSYDSPADVYAAEEERKRPPIAAFAVVGIIVLGGLGFGVFAIMKNMEAQHQAAVAQQTAQAAEQAAATQRQQLATRIATCSAHSERTMMTVVMQDCGDLVWSDDQSARDTATARVQAAANHREPAVDEPMPVLPVVFVDHGACPFEGCTYGVWTARAVNPLYDAPDGNQIGSIQVGDRIIAWTGDVYTTPLSGIVQTTNGIYQRGEGVYLLTYQGEGFYRIWHNSVISATPEQVGGDCGKDACTFDFGGREQQRHWWVQVRRQDGHTGWMLDPHEFDGMDAFG